MAVRREIFQMGIRFDERLGPKGRKYAMGDETELTLRLRGLGHEPVFLPRALVRHLIRPSQLDCRWLISRAFSYGQSEARLRGEASWYELARFAKHAIWAVAAYCDEALRRGRPKALHKRINCSVTRGQLYEAARMKLSRQLMR